MKELKQLDYADSLLDITKYYKPFKPSEILTGGKGNNYPIAVKLPNHYTIHFYDISTDERYTYQFKKSESFNQKHNLWNKKDEAASKKNMDKGLTRAESMYDVVDKLNKGIFEAKDLDPVDDDENDKKFAKRKDKDIDNDGDVDGSDKFLHKKRKAIDNSIDSKKKVDEAVSVENDRWERSHGSKKLPKGEAGLWMFTSERSGTPDYDDKKIVFQASGKFSEVKKAAKKWAKKEGHDTIYVMEGLDPVNDKANDKKFKNRKDKDIDNDGDVDGSDEFLHKKRKAIDNAVDGKEGATKDKSDSKAIKEHRGVFESGAALNDEINIVANLLKKRKRR